MYPSPENPDQRDQRHGDARHGDARHGDARHGDARHGDARHGDPRPGGPRHGGLRPPPSGPLPSSGPLSAPLAADVLPPSALPPEPAHAMPPPLRPPPLPPPALPPPALPPAPSAAVSPTDEQRARIRDDVEGLRLRASVAASWLETSSHYAQLINHAGVVPVTARFSREDLMFLGEARGQMLRFAELALRLVDLHQPGDAAGITTHPSSPILRCRSCMWRWPCPTFSIVTEVLDRPAPG